MKNVLIYLNNKDKLETLLKNIECIFTWRISYNIDKQKIMITLWVNDIKTFESYTVMYFLTNNICFEDEVKQMFKEINFQIIFDIRENLKNGVNL